MTGIGHSIAPPTKSRVYMPRWFIIRKRPLALSRQKHGNDSNVLVLGARFVDDGKYAGDH